MTSYKEAIKQQIKLRHINIYSNYAKTRCSTLNNLNLISFNKKNNSKWLIKNLNIDKSQYFY